MKEHSIRLLFRNTGFRLSLISAALLLSSLFLNLTAYLTTSSDPYSPLFRTASGAEFGLSISGAKYEKLPEDASEEEYYASAQRVMPRDVLTLSPVVKNAGSLPMYVFVTIETDGLELSGLSADWHELDDVQSTYYYGTDENIAEFNAGTQSRIFDDLIVPESASINSLFSPSVTAYGIQTENMSGKQLSSIWELIKGQQDSGETEEIEAEASETGGSTEGNP